MVLYSLITQVVFSGLVSILSCNFAANWKYCIFVVLCMASNDIFPGWFDFGNLNALVLETMGQIAGFAASVTGGVATVLDLYYQWL